MARATIFAQAIAAAAALSAAGAAIAAEPFNGPYVGVEAGWQQDRLKSSVTTGGLTLSTTDNGSGLGFGAYAGYDVKVSPSFVLGVEGAVSGDTGTIDLGVATADAGRTFSVTGRAGVLATPQTLIYGKGGWTNSRFTLESGADRGSVDRGGWTLGAGVEQALAPNVSARVEYRHARFNSYTEDLGAVDVAGRFSRNQIMAGVSYRF